MVVLLYAWGLKNLSLQNLQILSLLLIMWNALVETEQVGFLKKYNGKTICERHGATIKL